MPLAQLIAEASAGYTEIPLQRETADSPPSPDPAPEPSPTDTQTATPIASPTAVQTTTAIAPASPQPSALPTGAQLEELAQRLWEPLSARLRAELWLHRERTGQMVNLRH